MKKPSKALAALCLLNSASAYALGVGEIETHSSLNQVLNAQIPLVSSKKEDPSNLRISIASREAFQKAGIDRPHYLTELKFTPILDKNGDITVDVRSSSTIKEPFVNFILEVEWPQGRTLKEFTILLDPPITMSDVRTIPLELAKSPTITSTTTNAHVTTYIAPTAQATPPKEYGPTKSRDTVWSIAKTLIVNDHTVTHQQMMLALYDNNPKAFYKKNINALKKGAILHAPSHDQITERSALQANNDFRKQNALWSSSTKAVAAPTVVAKANQDTQQTAASDVKKKLKNNVEEATLTLLTPKQQETTDVPVEGNSVDTPVGSVNPSEQANMAIEMATTLEEENKEVKSRLNDLESQVDKLQRLLTLKDKQLAQLQSAKLADPIPAAKPSTTQITPVSNDESDSNLPLYGGGLVIALLGLFLARRKKQSSTANNEFTAPETASYTPSTEKESIKDSPKPSDDSTSIIEEEPLLSEFTPSEFDINAQSQEADPLTECDVYIAYGRFQQAEDLIKKALDSDQDNLDYKLKLLDVYFSSANSDAFAELAETLTSLKNSSPDTWSNISDMGADLCPNSDLFTSTGSDKIKIETAPVPNKLSDIEFESAVNASIETDNTPEQASTAETELDVTTAEPASEFEFDFNLIKNEVPADASSKETDIELSDIDINEEQDEDTEDTKISLAQAYIEMEDLTSARDALNEILESGSDSEKQQAQKMLNNL